VSHDRSAKRIAAIGFTVKSGWTAAVLVAGPASAPEVVDSCRVELSDPAVTESRQPYHASFGTARDTGPELTRLLESIRGYSESSLNDLFGRYRAAGHDLTGIGLVVGSLAAPETIANAHIRIHALEGQLFRGVIETAAARHRLTCSVWRQRDLGDHELRGPAAALGRGRPGWRAEQKWAALAALLALGAGRPAAARLAL
jgi:hypothetical protein